MKYYMGHVFDIPERKLEAMMSIVDNAQVHKRHSIFPVDYIIEPRPLSKTNDEYIEHAVKLGREAAEKCLERAGLRPDEIDLIITVSCTGFMILSLDAHLMFNRAIRWQRWLPKYLSSDNDPLYRFHQWQANLRILEVTEIKTVPYVPVSHPFVERLIGTIRREYLDHALFWTTADLENKLLDFGTYFNNHCTHISREGRTPETPVSRPVANLRSFRWQPHCRALYQTPVAA